MTTELEARYDLTGRWLGVAFVGFDRAADVLDPVARGRDAWALYPMNLGRMNRHKTTNETTHEMTKGGTL